MRKLERTLRLKDLIFIVVGAVIGSGIFIVPSTVLRQVQGDLGLALIVWFLAGILSLLGALTYGELGAMRPEAGGLYVYVREAFGPLPAFLLGWTLFFVIGSGSVAALSAAFSAYSARIMPSGPLTAKLVSIAMIVVVMAINVAGTRASSHVQNWTTALKFTAVIVMGVLLVAAGPGIEARGGTLAPRALTPAVLPGIGLAMIGVLWAYEGWQYATFSAGETIDPQRTFPLGIAAGTAAMIVLYCLANVAYASALGPAGIMETESVASTAVAAVFGPAAGRLIAGAILISIFSAANAIVLTSSRVFFAMARDGVFFRRLGHIDPRFGTPALSIAATCAWAMVLAATGTFDQLLTYVVFTGWIFYALGAASIFILRRRFPDAPRPFRVPGYPWTPALFVLAASAIVVNALIGQPGRASVGVAIVLLGAPAYLYWRSRPAVAPADVSPPA